MSGCHKPINGCRCGCHPALEKCGDCCIKNSCTCKCHLGALDCSISFYPTVAICKCHLPETVEDKIKNLTNLVNNHEEYLKKIDILSFHDPEKTIHNMKILEERIENLEYRNKNLENHKNNQIDTNRKISQRFDEIENNNKLIADKCINTLNEIHMLERNILKKIDYVRKPHKCPICDGKGFWNRVDNNVACGGQCQTCKGDGIVWG